jgi:putative effector of murein hydrolase
MIDMAGLSLLTLCSYLGCSWIYMRLGQPGLLHPLLSGTLPVALGIVLLDIPYADYRQAVRPISLVLGPATVALAVPLYLQLRHIRAMRRTLLPTLLSGAVLVPAVAVAVAALFDVSPGVLVTLSTKSVTSAFAMPVAEILGGYPALAAAVVIVTGIVAGACGPWVFARMSITDPRIQGFALGLVGHGVGTARAFGLGMQCGAFASLGMGLTALLTALVLPLLSGLFQR